MDEYNSDADAAPSPPVRLAKAPTGSKPPSKHSSSSLLEYRASQSSLDVRNSQQNLRGSADAASIGLPSIERPHRESFTGRDSSTDTAQGHELRHKKSREVLSERVNGANVEASVEGPKSRVPSGAAKFLRPIRSRGSLNNDDTGTTSDTPPYPEVLSASMSQSSGLSRTSQASPKSSESATGHGALNVHLIPSRRSSLRHSFDGNVREDDHKRYSKRYSMNLEDMAIDQSLIEEDHSTVKRIRELQEARERRQKEWRRESNRSDRTKPSPLSGSRSPQRATSRQSSRVSIAEELLPSAELADDRPAHAELPTSYKNDPRPASRTSNTVVVASTPLKDPSGSDDPSSRVLKKAAQSKNSIDPTQYVAAANRRSESPAVQNIRTSHGNDVDAEVEAFLDSPRLTQTIRHPQTGRIIAFSEVGDPNGFAVICCVGMGLTRYLTAFYDDLARSLKLRLITPDRPGIGDSEPCLDGTGIPLNWPNDVELICDHLGVMQFSLLAHSAGALYALATALKLPQRTRGRLHLLAPWITPSQMSAPGGMSREPSPAANIPFSQRFLSILPASFLKAANASFFGAASASMSKAPKPLPQRRSVVLSRAMSPASDGRASKSPTPVPVKAEAISCYQATNHNLALQTPTPQSPITGKPPTLPPISRTKTMTAQEHRALYDAALTPQIWSLATTNANPAVDLLICLEKHAPIGFLYTDITRAVVIHHGSRDTRVPIENVRWLAKRMKRCELRVLQGEGHGLMASANVMAEILGEIGAEWDEWSTVIKNKKGRRRGARPGEYSLDLDEEKSRMLEHMIK